MITIFPVNLKSNYLINLFRILFALKFDISRINLLAFTLPFWTSALFLVETPPDIKHYVIKTQKAPSNIHYYIGYTRFNSLPELITNYQQEQGDLCCRLTKPSNQESVIQRIDEYRPPHSIEKLEFWNIDSSDLTISKQIGQGSFGEVFECSLSTNDEIKLAIKFLKGKDNNNRDQRDEFDKETSFLKSLHHPYVDKLYG